MSERRSAAERLPVIAIAGYLGAGKTTTLESLVRGLQPARAGWIVQDVSGLHDAGLTFNAAWQRIEARLPDSGGCLGCALRADLVAEVRTAIARSDVDVLVLETPGIFDAEHAPRCLRADERLARTTCIRARVTVVDATTFIADLTEDEGELPLCGDDRSLAELRIAQVEQADVLVLTKTDEVEAEHAALVADLLARLGPGTPVLRPTEVHGAAAGILARHAPDDALTRTRPQPEDRPSRSGVTRLRFTAARPFHPARLAEALATPLPGVVRGRGRAWLASQPQVALQWDQTVGAIALEPVGTWPAEGAVDLELLGLDLDVEHVRRTLAACLLTDDELAAGPARWSAAAHPFPTWEVDALDVLPDPSPPGGNA